MAQVSGTETARRADLRKRIVGEDGLEVFRELRQGKDLTDTVFLLELLIHPNFVIREEALRTLAHRGGTLARIAARSALADLSDFVRDEAATVLGYVGNRRDIPWLLLALDDPDWCVRCSAADSLGRLGGPTARRCLVEALTSDPSPDVRRWAAGGLATLRDPTIVPTLEEALSQQTDPHVRGALLRALYQLGARPLEALLPLLRDEDYLMRFQMLSGLEQDIRPEDRRQAIAAVRELLEHEPCAGVRGDAETVLRKLLEAPEAVELTPA